MKNKFNKQEKEVIAYILSLDVENFKGNTQKNIISIVAKLQEERVFGNIPSKDFN
tara:strand:+ start:268 stop:432 length:165 start_codon:yes stop_codon:yes gene_type:complete